ncbi:peptidylprolyl isomerase [Saliterribacillus persicus]|uniref:Foldase protein PrsA n=1 Tax=Saliterribacillus persicus TaxID=930114 RepID=A0A368XQ45_9BACI|nr:peptidylprolyl isomerase [Saliterribacillus persicus]RCW69659.1 foldase protein PrsA [Saliterribacillus persicus]
MRKFVLATTIAAGVLTLSACSSDDPETVVETGSGDITKEEFYNELKSTSGSEVLQQMVLKTILENNYDVSDEEVDQEIETFKEQYGEQWESVLAQSGYEDEEAFKEDLRINLLQEKAVTEDIEVTDEEIENRYERMQTDLVASHILVEDEATANEVMEKIESGEDFATLAEEFSTDTASAANGGNLEQFSAGSMVPEFEEAAYALEIGEVSEPVQTDYGYHIIKVTDRVEAEDVEPLEDVKEEIRKEIAQTKIDQTAAQAKLQELMESAEIDVKIEEFKDLFEQPEAPTEGVTEEPVTEDEAEEPAAEEETETQE